MKRIAFLKTLLLAAGLSVGANAWAQTAPTEGVEAGTGDYYIYNLGSGKYLNKGVAYGTHSDVDGAGAVITISGNADDYQLRFEGISNKFFGTDAYVDKATDANEYTTWSFESAGEIDGYENVYKIKANKTSNYLYWANATGNPWANETWLSADVTGNSFYWILIPKATRQNYASASLANPIDATWRLKDPDFEGKNEGIGKAFTTWNTNGFAIQATVQDGYSGIFAEKWAGSSNNAGTVVNENYHLNDYSQAQTLSGLPLGKYRLSATAQAVQQGKEETIAGAYLFAGDQTTSVSTRGTYTVDFIFTGENVTVGMKTVSTTANWVSFDNLRLTYLEPAVSVIAINFASGIEMTANQWYKFTPTATDTYTFSAISGITYTSDAAHLPSEDGSAVSESMELTAGTTYYFKSATAQTLNVSATSALTTTSALTADGWEEVTSTDNLASNDHYYVFYSVEGVNLMMAHGKVSGYQQGENTMFYQSAADPASDRSEVWTIVYDETNKYGVRNLNNDSHLMQSRENEPYYVQFAWETSQSKWTRFNFKYAGGSWTIENNACKTQNPDTYFSNLYIGPWETQSFISGSAVAGNKEGANVGHFKIYRKARDLYENAALAEHRALIVSNKGDITSLINGTFDTNTDGWSGYTGYPNNLGRNWRGNGINPFIERNADGTMTTTIANMPAGTYKVVAAARSYVGGKIKAQVAGGEYGIEMTGTGDAKPADGTMEINTNGVEMPFSSLGGFTPVETGHNWHWISASGTLSESGDLVLNFTTTGNSWMAIDDVHLYCIELDGTNYTRTVGDGKGTINTNNSVVTADIVLDKPNTVLRTTGSITTAAGEAMNNDQYSSSRITKLVLYDGYEYTKLSDDVGADNGAILYRNIPADTWCTLTVPFWPTTTLTKKYPTAYSDGILTFSDVERTSWGGVDKPMLIKSTTALTAIEGKIASNNGGGCGVNHGDLTSGSGAPMTGVYTNGNVPQSTDDTKYYVVGSDNNLHKVTGTEVTIAPFRAYFSLTGSTAGEARSVIALDFGDETTAVEAVEIGQQAKDNAVYNLNGQRVNELRKGLYIVNGKKVFIK